ncbi:hypothetical protein RKD33_001246 [Streptomyces sp. SAI-129]
MLVVNAPGGARAGPVRVTPRGYGARSGQAGAHAAAGRRPARTGSADGPVRRPVGQSAALKLRRRRLLPTTKTEEKAMAAPAIIGLRSPAAASGRAATL